VNAADDVVVPEAQPLVRADFRKLFPIRSPAPIPSPDKRWSAQEWAAIRRGHKSRDMDDRWHAFVERDRLYLHRSWTGHGLYEAQFEQAEVGWRIGAARSCAVHSGTGQVSQLTNDLLKQMTAYLSSVTESHDSES
jgi:hypothetical protein